jgi:plasmid maintenance system killer protein
MKIYFRTSKLQNICSQEREMVKHFGTKKAGKLKQRLMELGAADTLADISYLPPARCHELAGKNAGIFSVDLEHPYRLLFISADEPLPLLADGRIDRIQVKEIEIIEIKDTH